MSTTIDQRVVQMQFDNRQFESNVQTSMSTLDKLKKSLNLDGASKGLENINNAAKSNNLGLMGSAAETVGLKFNAMYTMADQALRNITNKVQSVAGDLVNAFAIDPIKTGLAEYETQIGAVQTILANTESKGSTLGDVNAALDELNTYADKTIYNFTEMTRNIGTFTAAGVDLEKSTTSIKGIANLAAVSGSTSQQASTAMYQLSQALAAGKVSLMDWNSVVNAGMGGQVFQDALKRTATQMGTNVDAMIEKYGSFRESLTKGEWLTADVLTETLTQLSGAYTEADLIAQGYSEDQAKEITKLADTAVNAATKVKTFTQLIDTLKESAQSGWTQTWELLIGDFEEAKELWTGVSDTLGEVINNSSQRRNDLLGGALNNNWDKMMSKINEAGIESTKFEETLKGILTENGYDVEATIEKYGSLEKAFTSGAIHSTNLKEAVDKLSGGLEGLAEIEGEVAKGASGDNVKAIQEALSSFDLDLGKAGIDGVFGSKTEEAIKAFQKANNLEITGIVDEKTLAALQEATNGAEGLSEAVGGCIDEITKLGGRESIIESFKNVWEALVRIITPIKEAFEEIFPPMTSEQLYNMIEAVRMFTEKLIASDETVKNVKRTFKGLFSVVAIVVDVFKSIASGAAKVLGSIFGLSGGLVSGTAVIGDWLTNLRSSIKETDIFGKAIDSIASFISNTINKIKEFGSSLKNNLKAPSASGGLVGFFSALVGLIKKVGSVFGDLFGNITSTLSEAFGRGDIFELINSGLVTGMAFFITKFTKSLNDGFDGVNGVLENVTGILDDVRGCFQAYQEQLKAGTLMKIATAIGILAASIFVISTIDPESLAQSLGAITVLFAELLGSLAIFDKMGGSFKGTLKAIPLMISLASAILLLAIAMRTLANLSWSGVAKGLISVGVLMAELYVFMKYAKFDASMSASALGIILLASAMVIMSKAVEGFAGISWGGIVKGLIAIGALLAELVIFMKYAKLDASMAASAVGFVLIAASMKIFASAMGDFSSISWEGIAKSLVSMGVALAAMTLALRMIPSGSVFKAAGVIVAAVAIKILYSVLSELGSLSWSEMSKSLSTLGGSLSMLSFGLKAMKGSLQGSAALLIASAALAVLAPVMKVLGSLEWEQIGKGLVAMAGAFAVFGIAGALLAPITPALMGLSTALAVLGLAMIGIGAGLTLIGIGIGALSTGLAAGATAIAASLSSILIGILDLVPQIGEIIGKTILEAAAILGDYAPQLAESFCKLIVGVVDSLAEYAPQLLDSLLSLLIDLINGLTAHVPALVEAFFNLFGSIFDALIIALNDLDTDNFAKGIKVVVVMTLLTKMLAKVVAYIPAAMSGLLGVGVLIGELALILAALGAISKIPGLNWLISEGGNFLEGIGRALGKAVGGLIGGIGEAVSNSLPHIGENIAEMMTFLSAAGKDASTIKSGTFDGVTELIEAMSAIAGMTVKSSLSDIFTLGGTSMEKFQKDASAFFIAMRTIADVANGVTLDEGAIDAILAIATKLADMQSSLESIGGVVDWFTGRDDLATFGINAGSFIMSIKTAFGSLDNVSFNNEALDEVISAATQLSDLSLTLDGIGGVVEAFRGKKDLATFGENVKEFVESMKTAYSSLDGAEFNPAAMNQLVSAGQSLSGLQDSLKSVGGFVDLFTGRDDIGQFGANASIFIDNMKEAYSGLDGMSFNTEALGQIVEGAKELSKLQDSLKSVGGVIDWFTGRDNLRTFGVNAGVFILAMKTAYNTLDGESFDSEALGMIIDGAKKLSELQDSLKSVGGVIDWFTGRDDLGTFGRNAAEFILAMKIAYNTLDGEEFNVKAMNQIVLAARSLSTLQDSLKSVGGIIDWFTGRDDLGTFGINAADFILAMKMAYSTLDGADFNVKAMNQIVLAARSLASLQDQIEPIGSIITWLTGRSDLAQFGVNAAEFVVAMGLAYRSLNGAEFNVEAMNQLISAAKSLATLQSSLEPIGGVISWFIGRDDLGKFGTNVLRFVLSMKLAFSALDGVTFNSAAMATIVNTAIILSSLQSHLEPIGGVVTWFTGRDDLATFGISIVAFIGAMKLAFQALEGATFNTEAMSTVITAASELAKIQSSLTNMDGVISYFTGDKDLSTFGTKVAEFIGSMKTAFQTLEGATFNADAMAAIVTGASGLAELQANLTPMEGVISWFTGDRDLGTFGEQVGTFISSMKTAFSDMGDLTVNKDTISSIVSAATELATIQTSLEPMGGVISWFSQTTGLDTFGSQVASFIGSMKTAFADLGDTTINSDAMSSIITAATELATLQTSLPDIGGLVSYFTGDQMDLETFGNQIGAFATAMGKLRDGMGENGISEAVVSSITNTGNALVELNNALPEQGWFDTKEDLTTFSEHIQNFATAISDFSTTCAGLNSEGIDIAMNAANRIRVLIDKLADIDTSGVAAFTGIGTGGVGADGAVSDIADALVDFGTKVSGIDVEAVSTASTAATKIKNLIAGLVGLDYSGVEDFKIDSIGSAVKAYSDKVLGIDTGAVSTSVSAANRLKSLINGLSGLDSSGIVNFRPGSIGTALKAYSANVSGLNADAISASISAANKIKNFISGLAGLDTSGVSSFTSSISTLGQANVTSFTETFKSVDLSSVGSNIMSTLTNGIKSKNSSLTSTANSMVSAMSKTINDKSSSFNKAGVNLISNLIKGFSSKASALKSAVGTTASSASSALLSSYTKFYANGKYLGEGLVLGISAKKQSVWDAAYALGKAAVEGEKAGQQSNSPSKATIQAGKWFGEGLVIGIDKMGRSVYNSAKDVGQTAVNAMTSTVSKIASAIDSDIDAQPTIRPVLDLSDVQSGAGTINSLFNAQHSVGLAANLNAISTSMAARNQNGVNDDVVSAISKLGKQLSNIGGNAIHINGITYDDGSNVSNAVSEIIRAIRIERRA